MAPANDPEANLSAIVRSRVSPPLKARLICKINHPQMINNSAQHEYRPRHIICTYFIENIRQNYLLKENLIKD